LIATQVPTLKAQRAIFVSFASIIPKVSLLDWKINFETLYMLNRKFHKEHYSRKHLHFNIGKLVSKSTKLEYNKMMKSI